MDQRRVHLGGDGAASPVLGLLVAVIVFSLAFVAILQFAGAPGPSDAAAPDLQARADAAARLFVTEEALGEGERLDRFSLGAGGANVLDYDLIQRLRDAKLEAVPDDGVLDYPEARAALGLDDTYEFHLRSFPILRSVEEAEWVRHRGARAAYLGASTSDLRAAVGAEFLAPVEEAGVTRFRVSLTNAEADAGAARIYKVAFTLSDGRKTVRVDDQFSSLLAPGESQVVEVAYHEVGEWGGNGDLAVNATVHGPFGNELAWHDWTAQALPEGAGGDYNLIVDAGADHYLTSGEVTLFLDHFDGKGQRVKGNGALAVELTVTPPHRGAETFALELGSKVLQWSCREDAGSPGFCSGEGEYAVSLALPGGGRAATDRFTVTSGALFTDAAALTAGARYEAGLLEGLVERFHNVTYGSGTPPDVTGDRFVDTRESVADLVGALDRYDILVVGSNVRHSVMTSGDTKHPIAEWVEAGGHLMVLGSESQNTQWLQPLHGAGVANANGGVSTPDPTHPILTTPEDLRYASYQDHGKAWRLSSSDHYTHVISKEAQGGQQRDTLAVSNPGAFGNGTVVLSAYVPSELTAPQDRHEALKLLNNMVSTAYTMAFLDLGPEVPGGATVASAERIALLQHPDLPEAQVAVKLVVYVWR